MSEPPFKRLAPIVERIRLICRALRDRDVEDAIRVPLGARYDQLVDNGESFGDAAKGAEQEAILASLLDALDLADNPDLDATDGAHPAWWRGHDHAFLKFTDLLSSWVDEPAKQISNGHLQEPLEILRRRVCTLAINDGCLRAELEKKGEHERTKEEWAALLKQAQADFRELSKLHEAVLLTNEKLRAELIKRMGK